MPCARPVVADATAHSKSRPSDSLRISNGPPSPWLRYLAQRTDEVRGKAGASRLGGLSVGEMNAAMFTLLHGESPRFCHVVFSHHSFPAGACSFSDAWDDKWNGDDGAGLTEGVCMILVFWRAGVERAKWRVLQRYYAIRLAHKPADSTCAVGVSWLSVAAGVMRGSNGSLPCFHFYFACPWYFYDALKKHHPING